MYHAVKFKKHHFVKKLLDKGAKLELKNSLGYTSLFKAVQNDDLVMTKLLISKGADLNASNDDDTLASFATVRGGDSVYSLLLEKGADPTKKINGKDVFQKIKVFLSPPKRVALINNGFDFETVAFKPVGSEYYADELVKYCIENHENEILGRIIEFLQKKGKFDKFRFRSSVAEAITSNNKAAYEMSKAVDLDTDTKRIHYFRLSLSRLLELFKSTEFKFVSRISLEDSY